MVTWIRSITSGRMRSCRGSTLSYLSNVSINIDTTTTQYLLCLIVSGSRYALFSLTACSAPPRPETSGAKPNPAKPDVRGAYNVGLDFGGVEPHGFNHFWIAVRDLQKRGPFSACRCQFFLVTNPLDKCDCYNLPATVQPAAVTSTDSVYRLDLYPLDC